MKKIKLIFAIFLLLLSTAIVFSWGWWGKKKSGGSKSVEVWMINSPVPEIIEAFDTVGQDFEAKTGIKVNYVRIPTHDFHTKLVTSISARVYPDMIIWNSNPGVEFSNTGAVDIVDDIVNEVGRDQFGEGSLRMFTINGKLYEIPFMVRPAGIHARKDWLKKAGYNTKLKTDKNGIYYYEGLSTWEDLLEAGLKINDPANGKYGLGFPFSRKAFGDSAAFAYSVLACYGAHLVDENGNITINSQETIKGLEFIKKVWESGAVPAACTTWDGGSNNQFFIGGDIGIVHNSNSIMGKLNETTNCKPEDLMIIPFPAGPAGAFLASGPESITIFKKKDTSAARAYAKYLLRENVQVKMFKIMGFGYYSPLKKDVMKNPLFKKLDDNQKVLMQDSMKAINVSYPADPDGRLTALYSSFIFDDALSSIAVDNKSPEEVAAEMEKKVREALSD